jgi:glucan biosynthesis protein C
MDKKNINELDTLKTIIMFCVILFHSFISYVAFNSDNKLWPLEDQNQSIFLDPFILLLVTFGMPLCIFLSGFLLYILYEKKGPKTFITNRLKKMLFPILIIIPVLSIFLQPYFEAVEVTFTLMGVKLYTYHMWFAYYLIMVIISVYILSLMGKIKILKKIGDIAESIIILGFKYKYSWVLFPMIAILLPGDLSKGAIKISYSTIPDLSMFSSYFFIFYAGWVLNKNRYLLQKMKDNCYKTLAIGTLSHILLLLILTGIININPVMDILNVKAVEIFSVVSLFVMWGFTVGLFSFSLHIFGKKDKVLEYLANSSFAIYMIHFPLCVGFIYLFAPYDINPFLKGLMVFVLTSLASFSIYELIRRIENIIKRKNIIS